MYLVESVKPNVISPFATDPFFVGSKDTATRFSLIEPSAKRVSVIVGMILAPAASSEPDTVPDVKSLGPILRNTLLTQTQRQSDICAYPKIPSLGETPDDSFASPMGC
jgi:hypothetical protein